jgi:hypothetical protein
MNLYIFKIWLLDRKRKDKLFLIEELKIFLEVILVFQSRPQNNLDLFPKYELLNSE